MRNFFVGRTFKKKILKTIRQVFRKREVIGKEKVSQVRRKLPWERERIPHRKFPKKGKIPQGRGNFSRKGRNSA